MNQLFDLTGKPITITVVRPNEVIPISIWFKLLCEKLAEGPDKDQEGNHGSA